MNLRLTPEMSATLRELRNEKKFVESDFYPGAPTDEIRLRCEASVNRFIDEVLEILRLSGKKEELFRKVKALYVSFEDDDTEEREKVDDYVGEAMRAIGVDDWIDHV